MHVHGAPIPSTDVSNMRVARAGRIGVDRRRERARLCRPVRDHFDPPRRARTSPMLALRDGNLAMLLLFLF